MLKDFLVLLVLFVFFTSLNAQLWQESSLENVNNIEAYLHIPEKNRIYILDDAKMKTLLWACPQEGLRGIDSNPIIPFPLGDGTFDNFQVVEYSMMEKELAEGYPEIKTFYGYSLTHSYRTIRIDYTLLGLRAVISEKYDKTYIEYLSREDRHTRIIYSRKDYSKKKFWKCEFEEDSQGFHNNTPHRNIGSRAGDCLFRTYRLAQATTGEYSNFHGANNASQSGLVMSAITTTINRINEIYEQDITVRLILVNNTDDLFFYDPTTDPYTNSNGGTMLGQNQTTCDNIIGNANYDIGHVFSTGGGGVAYLNAVCNNSIKAGGVTGLSQPIGDPFDIDYVAHEVGHQFGAQHTQNNSCNRSNASAMEPGSASTIMGYAGICSPNVQNNSDPYFHAISIQEMTSRITSTSCHSTLSFSNAAPSLTNLQDYSIPVSTPFILTAEASDMDGDSLLYCWEQMNNQVAPMPPQSTNTVGPTFRSKIAESSPSRYFPPLNNVVNNSPNTWEVLPSVGRTMNFRVTVRDLPQINGNAGCTDEKNMVVTTVSGAGPFIITSHNTPTIWEEGEVVTISWNVANTNIAPINCGQVEIVLSYDGGSHFSTVMGTNLPNIGSANVTVPVGTSAQARFMVKAINNVFYDVNNAHITINPGPSTFFMAISPTSLNVCETDSAQLTVSTTVFNGFSGDVSFSVSNLPNGASALFDPPVVSAGLESTLTIGNLLNQSGTYYVTITGTSGNIVRNSIATLTIISQPQGVSLLSPNSNAQGVSLRPTLTWQNTNAASYEYQVSRNQDFSLIVDSGITNDTVLTVSDFLNGDATYYWRVSPVHSYCSMIWSDVWNFRTEKCSIVFTEDLPTTISPSGTPTINSYINVSDKGRISDVDVIELQGTHSWVGNLRFDLFRPNSSNFIRIWDRPCNSARNQDFDINFDDQVTVGSWPCPPTDGASYLPANSLNSFNSFALNGQWRLRVEDTVDQDGGILDNWGLKLCATDYCRLNVDQSYYEGIGSLAAAIDCAQSGDTITLTAALNNDTIFLEAISFVIDKRLTIRVSPNTMVFIKSNSDNPLFFIGQRGEVTLEGFSVLGSQSSEATIINTGALTLKNMTIYRSIGDPSASALINSSQLLHIEGQTVIRD